MYDMSDLFNMREIVGCKIEQLIEERSLTKSSFCANVGISRPTLDKIIDATITNKTNFEKHMGKVLNYLSLTPDELMGSIENPFCNVRQLRDFLNISVEELSRRSGISIAELKKIEAGDDASLSKLRDLACCLGTGVLGVLGENYFQTTLTYPELFRMYKEESIRSPGGFWGHLGIRMKGQAGFLWFPITAYTRKLIYNGLKKPYMAVPCMDNSLLLINTKHLIELTLLNDDCNMPNDMEWDASVSCGEIPAVVFEAFEDYMCCKENDCSSEEGILSEELYNFIEQIVTNGGIDIETFEMSLYSISVYFKDGKLRNHFIFFEKSDELEYTVRHIYELGDLPDDSMITLLDDDGAENIINMKQVSFIRLPLAQTEQAIFKMRQETLE